MVRKVCLKLFNCIHTPFLRIPLCLELIYRFFFLSALIVAFYLSGAFINTIWTQWSTSTIVVMGSNRVPVVDIPFPAVTICNTNLVKRSVVEQIDPASREFQIVDDFCDSEYESMVVNDTWVNMYRVIKNVSFYEIQVPIHVEHINSNG